MNIPIRTTQCYPNPNHFRSIVSDMNWVCEDAWVPAMSQVCNLSLFQTNSLCLQSIFFLGAVPGMLFFGWFWWVFIKSMQRKLFLFFSAITTVDCQPSSSPTWSLWSPVLLRPLSLSASHSLSSGLKLLKLSSSFYIYLNSSQVSHGTLFQHFLHRALHTG